MSQTESITNQALLSLCRIGMLGRASTGATSRLAAGEQPLSASIDCTTLALTSSLPMQDVIALLAEHDESAWFKVPLIYGRHQQPLLP